MHENNIANYGDMHASSQFLVFKIDNKKRVMYDLILMRACLFVYVCLHVCAHSHHLPNVDSLVTYEQLNQPTILIK